MATTKNSKRSIAARKGAKTRAANKAGWERYYKIDAPALRRIDVLLNRLLKHKIVTLRWLGDHKLKGSVIHGRLIKTMHGGKTWRVIIDGYKRPQDFYPAFWEVIGE